MKCTIETLEQRLALSVSIDVVDSTLRIIGDDGPQGVLVFEHITSEGLQMTVRVDVDGNGSAADPVDIQQTFTGITALDVRLGGGDDGFAYTISDSLVTQTRTVFVDLGKGDDSFYTLNGPATSLDSGTQMTYEVLGRQGNDYASITLYNVLGGSSFDFDTDLASGADQFVAIFGEIGNGTVSLNGDLGQGEDRFRTFLDPEHFSLSETSSQLKLRIDAGQGDDDMSMEGTFDPAVLVRGLIDVKLLGQQGDDVSDVIFDNVTLNGGTLRVRALGAQGRDTSSVAVLLSPFSTGGVLDIVLSGGQGKDILTLSIDDQADNSTGSALLNGGKGRDECTVFGNGNVIKEDCEF